MKLTFGIIVVGGKDNQERVAKVKLVIFLYGFLPLSIKKAVT